VVRWKKRRKKQDNLPAFIAVIYLKNFQKSRFVGFSIKRLIVCKEN
jgi:hypothetical protein